MKINIMKIDENVVKGTDIIMYSAVELMNKVIMAKSDEEAIQIAQEMDSPVDVLEGLYRYIQRIKFMGSKGNVANLTSLLACEDNNVLRDTLRQWKEAEEMMWEIVPAKEEN